MKRDEWTFEMKAEDVAKAATEKVSHHTGRLEFWQAAQKKVMDEVKEKGLSIEVSLAGADYSGSFASNVRNAPTPQIMVDQTYQTRLSEAANKAKEHSRKVAEYEGWVQVLTANGGRMYPLHADDYLYFFGK